MTVLNLACGHTTSSSCINIDWSINLRLARNPFLYSLARYVLAPQRVRMLEGLRANKNNLIAHDLTKGIPCPDNSVDAVYHSHFLAHLDRNLADPAQDAALIFLKECRRVLKPGGVMRSVVPDLEYFARAYLAHLELAAAHPDECAQHEKYVSDIIEMAARKKPFAASMQRPIMRRIESLLLGDARKRGETQQWWYDRINLKVLLESAGFHSIREFDYRTSSIADWSQFGFDQNADGTPYQRHSLFLEAVK